MRQKMKSSDPSMQTTGYLQPALYCEAKAGLSLSARTLFSHTPLNSVDTVMLCYLPFSQWFCDQQKKWRTADFSYVKEGLENPVLGLCMEGQGGREAGRTLIWVPAPQRRSPVEKCFLHWGGELPRTFSSAPNLQQASLEKGGGVEQGGGWGRRPGKLLFDKGSRNRASLRSYFTAPQAHMPRLANVMGQGPPRG